MDRSTNRLTYVGTGVLLAVGMVVIGGIGGFVGVADAATANAATERITSPQDRWNQTYGGESRDRASAVVETNDGGYLLAGETSSSGAGSSDVWVVKVDETGTEEWNRTYGGTGYDVASAVVETDDGGYLLAGHTSSSGAGFWDAWAVKIDETGAEEWNRTYGGERRDRATSIVETDSGGYLLAGETASSGAGSSDAWAMKIDETGTEEWSQTYGGASSDTAHSVVETDGGGYLLAGETASLGAGSSDAWAVKIDGTGAEEWSQTYGGEGLDRASAVVETGGGGYLLAGQTTSSGAGSSDAWAVKIGETGTEEWSQTYGGAWFDQASAVVETNDGGYLLAGRAYGDGGSDAWAAKIDGTGAEEWNETYAGTGYDVASAVIETNDGGYLLAGRTSSTADGIGAWLVKLGPTLVQMDVDVEPESDRNAINPDSGGVISVAIHNTTDVDPTAIDVSTLTVGAPDETDGGGAAPVHDGHFEDVDDDGDTDLVVHVEARATGVDADDTEVRVVGRLLDGTPVDGTDGVETVGNKASHEWRALGAGTAGEIVELDTRRHLFVRVGSLFLAATR